MTSRKGAALTFVAIVALMVALLGSILWLSRSDAEQREQAQEQAKFSARDREALAQTVDLLRRQLLREGVTPAAPPADTIVEGLPGPPGPAGAVGAPGLDGLPGASVTGPRGLPGVDGKDGAAGQAGGAGKDGVGEPGTDGKDGAAGEPGGDSTVPGPTGPSGADSTVAGPQGAPGADSTVPGPQGPAGPAPSSFSFVAQGVTYTCTDPDLDGNYTCTQEGPP